MVSPNADADRRPNAGRPVVLLVDDEPDILDSMRELLRMALPQADVLTAASGTAALGVLRQRRADVVVTDYKMPGMNGLEFLRAARASAPASSRILVTAFPDLDIAVRALNDEGIDHFFTKPLDPNAVVEGVRALLRRRDERAAEGRALAGAFQRVRAANRPPAPEGTA